MSLASFEGDMPTEDERKSLRRVADELPWSAWSVKSQLELLLCTHSLTRIVALIELAERAAYYGVSGPFQNYIQNQYNSPSGLPGALGLGQATATRLTNFFQFFCYFTPVFGSFLMLCQSKCRVLTD